MYSAIGMAQHICGHDAPAVSKELYDRVVAIHNAFGPDILAEIEEPALPFISINLYDCVDRALGLYDDLSERAGSIKACRARHPSGLTCGDPESWIFGPRDKVGTKLKDWMTLFGDKFTIKELKSFRSDYTSDPIVTFWITDGSTTAHFMVNLVTNDQSLIEVESVSPEFLKMLRIDLVPVDENGNASLEDSWNAGMNRLRIRKIEGQEFGAVWNYYVD